MSNLVQAGPARILSAWWYVSFRFLLIEVALPMQQGALQDFQPSAANLLTTASHTQNQQTFPPPRHYYLPTRLPGIVFRAKGDSKQLISSIQAHIMTLPLSTTILSGHGLHEVEKPPLLPTHPLPHPS